VIEDVSTTRGIRLLSIIHNGIILGSVCVFGGFDGEEFRSSSVTGRGIYVVDVIT
jgi:hypothetical protein